MITAYLPPLLFVGVVMALTGMLTGGLVPTARAVLPPDTCDRCGGPATPGHQCGR